MEATRRARRCRLWAPLLVPLLAACGLLDGGTSAAGGRAPVNLRVLMTDDWADTRPFVDSVRSFEQAHPAVRVQVRKTSINKIMRTVDDAVAQGAAPDVVQGHAFAAAARGLAQPVDDLWVSAGLTEAEFLPEVVEDVTWAGRRYGVPLDTTAVVLFYNARHFAEAGLAAPATGISLADLEQISAALTSADGTRRAWVLSDNTWTAFAWMAAHGGDLVEVSEEGVPTFTLDRPENIAALRSLRRLIERGQAFHTGPRSLTDDALALVRSGAASLYLSGAYDLVTLEKNGVTDEIRVAPILAGDGGRPRPSALGGSSLFIPEGSENRDLAFEFIRHLTADEVALRFARQEGRLPARSRVLERHDLGRPALGAALPQIASARLYRMEAFPEMRAAFGVAVREVLGGRGDPEALLREAQRGAAVQPPS